MSEKAIDQLTKTIEDKLKKLSESIEDTADKGAEDMQAICELNSNAPCED